MPARRRVIAALTVALVWPAAAHGQSPGLVEADSRFVALFAKGRFEEALPFAERALELSEREFGPDHPEVAAKLNSLAEVYRAQGKFFVAEALHLRALEIREKALRPDDPALAQSHRQSGQGLPRALSLRPRRAASEAGIGERPRRRGLARPLGVLHGGGRYGVPAR